MRWKLKARIQNAIALLPPSTSYAAYFWLQRRFGGLRRIDPIAKLSEGMEIWRRIEKQQRAPAGKVFFEVGTGRVPLVPLAYWLMGAEKTITIDANPYVREELLLECVSDIVANQDAVLKLLGPSVDRSRFNELISISRNPRFSTSDMLDLCRVEYVAPGDAAATNLSGKSIDYHTSYTVLEHIPPVVLRAIMEEGNRIMRDGGLFIHRIDYSDHFSHSDRSITGINFLQYSDEEWERYAGNRYMYMNRLRHDDYVALFETVGHRILATESDMDERSHALLTADQFHLDKRFSPKSAGVLAMSGSWIVTEKRA